MKSLLSLTLFAALACGQQAPAPTISTTTPSPAIQWVAAAPSYSGARFGASVAFGLTILPTQGIGSYTVMDVTFYKGRPTDILGTGFDWQVKHFATKTWDFDLYLLTMPSVVTTPTATTASFQGGMTGDAIWKKRIGILGGYRGLTGSTTTGKIWNLGIEWRP